MKETMAVILKIHHIVLSALGTACFTTLLNRSITVLFKSAAKLVIFAFV